MPCTINDWNALAPPAEVAFTSDVQIWLARIPQTGIAPPALMGLLSPAEQRRAARFSSPPARREFSFGRAVLRQILGACLKVAPAAVTLGCQPAGKPFLSPPFSESDLNFNLSHSREMLAVAVSWGRAVGVDLEWRGGFEDWSEVAGRIFSARELAELFALPPPQQRAAFFNGWTRKEAWLKATGEGLSDALGEIEVTLAPDQAPQLRQLPGGPAAARRWTLYNLPLPDDYAGACVVQNPFPI